MKSLHHRDTENTEDAQSTEQRKSSHQLPTGLPRAFDLTLSFIGLILAAPLLLIAGAAIALTSSGGVLFRQQRVGRGGELFLLYKLRTMIVSTSGPQVTSSSDPRITRVGRFLRVTKLDELPTLWNVLKGEMAMVGPRPEVPRYVKLDDPSWRIILRARPGVTDPVTLDLRNESELLLQVEGDTEEYYLTQLQPQKMQGYVDYLKQRTWQSDLKVLCQTLFAVVVPQRTDEIAVHRFRR